MLSRRKLLVALICVASTIASAQAPSDAERLFQEGLKLMNENKPTEACEKFEQAILKDPRAIGVLLNLGRCNESAGRIATAYLRYQEALDRATEAKLPGAHDLAKKEIDRLAPKVPVIQIKRSATPLDGEQLVVAEQVVPLTKTELQLDPGKHTIVLTAPGRLPFRRTIDVAIGDKQEVVLPVLELPKEKVTRVSRRRLVGKIATFTGGGMLIAAGGLALYAKYDYEKLFDDPDGSGPKRAHCGAFPDINGEPVCDSTGASRAQRDHNLGTAATVLTITGVVAAGAGIALWLTSPSEETRIVPSGTATSVGATIVGTF